VVGARKRFCVLGWRAPDLFQERGDVGGVNVHQFVSGAHRVAPVRGACRKSSHFESGPLMTRQVDRPEWTTLSICYPPTVQVLTPTLPEPRPRPPHYNPMGSGPPGRTELLLCAGPAQNPQSLGSGFAIIFPEAGLYRGASLIRNCPPPLGPP